MSDNKSSLAIEYSGAGATEEYEPPVYEWAILLQPGSGSPDDDEDPVEPPAVEDDDPGVEEPAAG